MLLALLMTQTPVFQGDLQAKLSPELVMTAVAPNDNGVKSGGVGNAYGEVSWARGPFELEGKGECSLYDSSAFAPKPLGVKAPSDTSATCLLREGYAQTVFDHFGLAVGKRTLDFSQASLTSPANPATVGLMLPSPLDPQEGLWVAEAKWTIDSRYSLFLGSAVDPLQNYAPRPYARVKGSFESWDVSASAADKFLGLSVNYQLNSNWLFYYETNGHIPVADSYAVSNLQSDFLFGSTYSPSALPWVISAEYFHNSNGILAGEEQGPQQGRLMQTNRRNIYPLPAPSSEDPPLFGATDFLSRDFVFLFVRGLPLTSGPVSSILVSLNDGSLYTDLGYAWYFGVNTKEPWKLMVEWKRFAGAAGSDFGQAALYQGSNQLVVTLGARL